MVEIEEVKDSFRKFREEFWEDVADLNLERTNIDVEGIKTRMSKSDYFKAIRDFAKERGWDVENMDLVISAKRGEETVEIDLVSCTDENVIFIKPWSRVLDRLKRLE